MTQKKSLSDLIQQATKAESKFSSQHVRKLVDSGKRPVLKSIRSHHPRKVNRLFNPLKLFVMISIVGIISLVLILGTPGQEESLELRTQEAEHSTKNSEMGDSVLGIEDSVFGTGYSVLGEKEVQSDIDPVIHDEIDTPELLGISEPEKNDIVPIAEKKIEDTCFVGEVLKLTQEQFIQIGFEFNESGFYYLNQIGSSKVVNFFSHTEKRGTGKSHSSGFLQHGVGKHRYNQKEISNKSYYPVCRTSLYGKHVLTGVAGMKEFVEQFEFANDTLTPVLFQWSKIKANPKDDLLLWFVTDSSFFHDVFAENSSEYFLNQQKLKELTKAFPGVDRVNFNYETVDPSIGKLIRLDKEYLACFGIRENKDSLIYVYNYNGSAVQFHKSEWSGGVRFINNETEMSNLGERIVPPLLRLYDDKLAGTVSTNPNKYPHLDSTFNENDWIDICIPIRFNAKPDEPGYATTFWFYPTEELFSCLPDSIGSVMRQEFIRNVKPVLTGSQIGKTSIIHITGVLNEKESSDTLKEDPVPCQYFTSFCEGLPGLDNLNVYPNPASEQVSIDILISREKTIQYRIFDIAGRMMNDELPVKSYSEAGRYTESLDISPLKSGLYLLVLTDNEGARMTKRVLKN